MPYYRRWRIEGGVYFFTLVTHRRKKVFASARARTMLRHAIAEARQRLAFEVPAIVLLPDHLHLLMRLPEGQSDFPSRVAKIKRNFTERYLAGGAKERAVSRGKSRQRYRGVWQARYYEHAIRDFEDFRRHADYIHVNPVKHGLARRPADWPWSTFHRYVKEGWYEPDWCGHVALPGEAFVEPEGL